MANKKEGPVDTRMKLPAAVALEVFLSHPGASAAWGLD